uniref:Ig-like domain-containing protein n=1 Tax=Flavobacterium sp. TaxID=239 RepID=UPI0037BE3933
MRHIYAKRLFLLASTLLISNVLFSNTFENKINNNSPIKVNSVTTNLVNEHFETVKVVTGPLISNQPQSTINCVGTTATFTVVASGTGTLTYSWKKNGTALTDGGTISGATTSTITIANVISTDADSYTCDITDSTGTTSSTPATLTVNSNITTSFTQVSAICSGATLTALPATSNNGITGAWTPALNNTATTTYTFTPTTGQCATNATMTITVNTNATPTFTTVPAICSGATLTALPTTSNNGITGAWTPALNNTATTTYTFTPTTGQCATTATMTITVNTNITPTFTTVPAICSGATLTALPTTSNNGITGAWTPALNNTATTTYTFTPTAGQCATTATMTITVKALPTLIKDVNSPTAICIGQSARLEITGADSYLWNTESTSSSITVSPTSSITYTVEGTNSNGCTKTETFRVQVNALPILTITGNSTICNGTSTTLTATGATSYNWGGSLTTSSIVVNPTSNSNYTVTGTDNNGCINSASQQVTVKAIPNASVNATTPICAGNIAIFTITGTPNATVSYNIGAGSNTSITLNNSGLATVNIPGATLSQTLNLVSVSLLGCQSTTFSTPSATVVVNPIPATPGTSVINYCQNQTASPLTATGSNLKWYALSSGGAAETTAPTPNTAIVGTSTPYYVSQTSVNGCESLRTPITVIVNALPNV